MKNSFLINIILLVCINLLIKPAYIFAVEIPVQNLVGNHAYGMYFTFLNLAYIFQLISDLGLQNVTYTDLPRKKEGFPDLLSNIVALRLLLAGLFILCLSVTGYALGYWSLDAKLFSIIMFNVLLVSTLQYIRANVSGLGLYMKDSLLSVVDKAIMLLVLVFLLYGENSGQINIHTFALVQTMAYALAIVVGLFIISKRISWIKPTWKQMRFYLIRSLPFGLAIMLMFLYTRIDAIMIEKMLHDGLVQAGYYASAYRLYDAATMITFLFAGLLLPMFSELDKHHADRQKLFYGSFSMIIASACLIAAPMIALRSEVMTSLYPETTSNSIQSFAILMLAFIIKAPIFVSCTLLASARLFTPMITLFVVCIVLNIMVNFMVIPSHGISGASFATFLTQFIVAVGCSIMCHKYGLIEFKGRSYGKVLVFALTVGGVIGGLVLYNPFTNLIVSMITVTVLLGLLYLLLNYKLIAQLSVRLGRH